MLAFRWNLPDGDPWKLWEMIIKAGIASVAQIVGMVCVLFYEVAMQLARKTSFCESPPGMGGMRYMLGAMSMMFAFVILVFSLNEFRNYRQCGMYRIHPTDLRNKPYFVHAFWISFGRFLNTAVTMMVLAGSILMLWLCNDPNSIVYDAIAMFFLVDMDNLFVTVEDYREIENFLKCYRHDRHKQDYRIALPFEAFNFLVHWYQVAGICIIVCGAVCVACFVCVCPTPLPE